MSPTLYRAVKSIDLTARAWAINHNSPADSITSYPSKSRPVAGLRRPSNAAEMLIVLHRTRCVPSTTGKMTLPSSSTKDFCAPWALVSSLLGVSDTIRLLIVSLPSSPARLLFWGLPLLQLHLSTSPIKVVAKTNLKNMYVNQKWCLVPDSFAKSASVGHRGCGIWSQCKCFLSICKGCEKFWRLTLMYVKGETSGISISACHPSMSACRSKGPTSRILDTKMRDRSCFRLRTGQPQRPTSIAKRRTMLVHGQYLHQNRTSILGIPSILAWAWPWAWP